MDFVTIMREDFVNVLNYLSKKEKHLPRGCQTSEKVFDKFNATKRVTEDDVKNAADLQVATLSYIMGELEKSPKVTVMAMEQLHNGKKIKDAFLDNFTYNFQTQEGIFFSNVLKNAIAKAAVN